MNCDDLRRRKPLGDLQRFVDDDRARRRGLVEQLEEREAQDVAVHDGIRASRQWSACFEMIASRSSRCDERAGHEPAREVLDALGRFLQVVMTAGTSPGRGARHVVLVQHLERELPGLAAGAHSGLPEAAAQVRHLDRRLGGLDALVRALAGLLHRLARQDPEPDRDGPSGPSARRARRRPSGRGLRGASSPRARSPRARPRHGGGRPRCRALAAGGDLEGARHARHRDVGRAGAAAAQRVERGARASRRSRWDSTGRTRRPRAILPHRGCPRTASEREGRRGRGGAQRACFEGSDDSTRFEEERIVTRG